MISRVVKPIIRFNDRIILFKKINVGKEFARDIWTNSILVLRANYQVSTLVRIMSRCTEMLRAEWNLFNSIKV